MLLESLREDFGRVWDAYPRHESRREAEKAFAKIRPDAGTVERMLAWIAEAKESEQWQDRSKIPHLSTMLNQRRYESDPPPQEQQRELPPPSPTDPDRTRYLKALEDFLAGRSTRDPRIQV